MKPLPTSQRPLADTASKTCFLYRWPPLSPDDLLDIKHGSSGPNRQPAGLGRAESDRQLRPPQTSRPFDDVPIGAVREATRLTTARFSLLRQQRRLWSFSAGGGRSGFTRATYRQN